MSPLCPPRTPRFAPRQGFTLVELLTVLAIVGILAAILIPVVGRIRESARTSNCVSNLKGTGTAFQLYAADNKGFYPALRTQPAYEGVPGTNPTGKNWQEELSPYQDREVDDLGNLKAESDSYVFCPEFVARYRDHPKWSSETRTSAGYGMSPNLGVSGINVYNFRFKAALIPHPARTILAGDSASFHLDVKTTWTPNAARLGGYNSGDPDRHRAKSNYLFADGHVVTFSLDDALHALVNRPPN